MTVHSPTWQTRYSKLKPQSYCWDYIFTKCVPHIDAKTMTVRQKYMLSPGVES